MYRREQLPCHIYTDQFQKITDFKTEFEFFKHLRFFSRMVPYPPVHRFENQGNPEQYGGF